MDNESHETELFLTLLKRVASLPVDEKETSMLDIAGYPHYENVVSNILAFYFDPALEHGMGQAPCMALLQAVGADLEELGEVVNVSREYPTLGGGRLDILIETSNMVIGIENKIHAAVTNDLNDYSNTIENLAGNHRIPIKILLAPKPEVNSLKGGFVALSYAQLFEQLRLSLVDLKPDNPKWLYYLNDLETSIISNQGGNMQFTELETLLIEQQGTVNKLLEAKRRMEQKVARKQAAIESLIVLPEEYNTWRFQHYLVFDLSVNEQTLAFDFYWSAEKGWSLVLFGRKKAGSQILMDLVKNTGLRELVNDAPLVKENGAFKYRIYTASHETDIDVLAAEINRCLQELVTATNEYENQLLTLTGQ